MRSSQLARSAALNERYCNTPCTLSRGGTLVSPQPTMTNGTPLRGRWLVKGTWSLPGMGSLDGQPKWRISLPDPLANPPARILVGDVLTRDSGTFGVLRVDDPESWSAATTVFALQLTDAAGTPLYLRPNATVSVTRQDGTAITGGTSRPVHIADSRATMERLMPYGEVGDRMLLDVLTADYQASDIVTIMTFGSSMAPIGFADYVVQAQPVANSEAGVEWLEVWLRGHRNVPNG